MKSRTAEKTVEALMTRFNKNPQSLVFSRLADEYRKDGNYSKAIEICTNGLQNHPDYVTGRIVLGMCYTEQGNHQAAIQELLAVIALDRKNQSAMKLLADLFNRQGNGQTAGELYHILSKFDPGNRSLQIISKQFAFSGNTDIFSILGLPSPQTSFNFKAKDQTYSGNIDNTTIEQPSEQPSFHEAQTMALSEDGFDEQPGNDNSSQVTSEEVGSRMDEMFGLSEDSSPVSQQSNQQILQELDSGESLSGEDIADRMNALFNGEQPQEIIETVGGTGDSQLAMFDSDEQIQPPDVPSMNLTPDNLTENSDLSGNEVSDHIDSLFGDDSMQQPESGSAPSLDIMDNGNSEMLTGNDLQNHLDLLMPSDSPQSSTIEPDFNDAIIETALSNTNHDAGDATGISGNDFADHLDSLTNDDDKIIMSTDTSDDLQQDLLSMNDEETEAPADETLRGDDFASHMDSLLSSDDIQPDLQSTNDFGNVINLDSNEQNLLSNEPFSASESSDSPFLQGMAPELQQYDESSDNSLILDSTNTDDTSIPDSPFEVASVPAPEEDTLTGADFATHMDMLLGDEESPDQSIYNKISNDFETNASSPMPGTDDDIVSSDDIGNAFDKMTGDLQNELIEEPYESSQDSIETVGTGNEITLEDDSVSGDDIVDKLDIISSDFSSDRQSDYLELPDEQVNGSDVSDRIGALENEPFLNIDQVGSDGNTPDISPFANTEFEETMQLDRSFIDNVQSFSNKNIQEDNIQEDNIQEDNVQEESVQEESVVENSQVPHHVNPFEFENETIQIDRSELFAHQADSVQNDGDALILDIENPTPNQDSLYVADDIQVEQDDQSISEMDVLVEPSKDIRYVTGEDVIDKLDNIFTEEDNGQETPAAAESIPEDIFSSGTSSDITTESISETAQWPDAALQEYPPAQGNDDLTGNDVEQRLDEFFSKDNATESQEDQRYQEAAEELEITDDYQDEGSFMLTELESNMENEEARSDYNNQESAATFDNPDMLPEFSENVNNGQPEGTDNAAPLSGVDTRDKPYSIPDHVLTPTLADIYFQQGQYQLSLQIYSRLIEKDPSNLNLQDRYDEIQTYLAAQEVQPGQFYDFGNEQEQSRGKKKSADTDKPLSGVRIKKSKKPKK